MRLRLAKYLFFAVIAAINFGLFGSAQAEEKDSTTMNDFLIYLQTELFSESSNSEGFLLEYRTGTWSWDISEIVNAYTPEDVSQGYLTQVIEASISDFTEFSRFSQEEADQNKRAYRINRYHLDPNHTDYLRYFSQYFKVPIFPGDVNLSEARFFEFEMPIFPSDVNFNETRFFEVVIRVFKKHGADQDSIEANLFWQPH